MLIGANVLRADGEGDDLVEAEVLHDDLVRGEGDLLRSQREFTEPSRLQPPWEKIPD